MRGRRGLFWSTSLVALVAAGVPPWSAPGALAATISVPNGATVGLQVLNDGDKLVVEQGGAVESAGSAVEDAMFFLTIAIDNKGTIRSTGADAVLTFSTLTMDNSGTIEAFTGGVVADIIPRLTNTGLIQGGNANGVYATNMIELLNSGTIASATGVLTEAMGTLVNSGTIIGTTGAAIMSDMSAGSVTNTGLIQGFSNGVFVANGDLGMLNNSGTITGDMAVRVDGVLGSLTNSGEILGRYGVRADQIDFLANAGNIIGTEIGVLAIGSANIINTGLTKGADYGIAAQTLTLVNSGVIEGTDFAGIAASVIESLNNTGTISGGQVAIDGLDIIALTNSGTIKGASPTDYAIFESAAQGADTLLTLNAGSVIIGHVEISPDNDTLNVGDGLNLALTFDTSVPELIETNGNPFVVIGTTVHVVDASALQAATDLTAGLAGGIGGAVSTGLRQGFDELGVGGETNVWLEGFGAAGQGAAGRSLLGGVAAGADFGPDADHRFGAFAGGGRGIMSATASSAQLDSLYAGIYGSAQFEAFEVEGVFAAGLIETDHSRTVANNTVATGLETATGTETAWFLAPQVTLRKGFVTAETMWDASVTFGYTGVFSGGYSETGIEAPLTVNAGTSHILDAKALLSLPYENAQAGGGVLTADVHAGITGRAVIGGAPNGTLGGTALSLSSANALAAGLTAGLAFDYEFSPGATLYGGIDGNVSHDLAFGASAEAGLKGTF